MTSRNWIVLMMLLLAAGGVRAEGGKERGAVGQGTVVQTQVREVDPPAQWTAPGSLPVTDAQGIAKPSDELSQVEEDEWF